MGSSDPAAGKLIVVIDDDALVLDAMRGILRSWGCRVVTAASERAAHARLGEIKRAPDLIIADYRLADGKTGIEAIKHLREAFGVAIPALLVSGEVPPGRAGDGSANGCPLLRKPVPMAKLRATLERLLAGSAGRGGS